MVHNVASVRKDVLDICKNAFVNFLFPIDIPGLVNMHGQYQTKLVAISNYNVSIPVIQFAFLGYILIDGNPGHN